MAFEKSQSEWFIKMIYKKIMNDCDLINRNFEQSSFATPRPVP